MDSETLVGLTVIFAMLDILMIIIRAGFIYARLPQLGGLRSQYPNAVDATLRFIERPHLTATLRLLVVFSHMLLAGSASLLIYSFLADKSRIWVPMLSMPGLTILLLLAEFAVEGLILRRVEFWAIRLTPLAKIMDFLVRPVSLLLMAALGKPNGLDRSLGSVTDDELLNWVETGQSESKLEQGERKMIYSIFQLGDTLAREIMVPRIDVVALDVDDHFSDVIALMRSSGHSRLPVYQDVIDNVIGILYAKDMLGVPGCETHPEENMIRSLMRQAYFIPEAKKADELLSEMLEDRVHMAIVIDEYGGMAGLVTLEDIVEEIVGEIRDEFDQGEENPYQKISDTEYLFMARIDLDDFNEITGARLTNEIADTLGGWLYGEIGRVPAGGEQVQVDDWLLTVENVSGRRIRQVRAAKIGEPALKDPSNDPEAGEHE